MNQFPTADQLCNWAGICPGATTDRPERAGAAISGGATNSCWPHWCGGVLGSDPERGLGVFSANTARWLKKGEQKAIIAVCHCVLRVIWSVLEEKDGPYVEPDAVGAGKSGTSGNRSGTMRANWSEMGADEQTIRTLVDSLLQAPPSPEPVAERVSAGDSLKPTPRGPHRLPAWRMRTIPPRKRPLCARSARLPNPHRA